MKPDPAIEEIRAVRHEISAEFGHDTRALVDHYRQLEQAAEKQASAQRREDRERQLEQDLPW